MQESFRKVKLQLIQPQIMCAGREPVTCYYRGKVITEYFDMKIVAFKSFGVEVFVQFKGEQCITEDWQDLKIIK